VSQFGVNNFVVSDPVVQVLCGEFTGPGSTAMAVEIGNAPTCWGVQRWEVFSFTGGAWQLTFDREEFVSGSLVAVGSDIRVTTPVFIKGDSRCTPSGGTSTRTWHWTGTRFVAGPGTIKRPKVVSRYSFQTPSHNIFCDMGDEDTVYCTSKHRPHTASLDSKGHVTICNGRKCLGPGHATPTNGLPVLEYGQRDEYARFVCRSEKRGLTCTPKGRSRGFRISSAEVKRVG
jgi:hypothetical protein